MPLDAEELQSGLGDPAAWQQEYGCQFTDTSAVLLSYDLLHVFQNPAATHQIDPYYLTATAGPIFCGVAFDPDLQIPRGRLKQTLPSAQSQSPVYDHGDSPGEQSLHDWRLETGDWRLETGDWRLETGDWRLETASGGDASEGAYQPGAAPQVQALIANQKG